MIVIEEYIDLEGNSPFQKWFIRLDVQAAAKITTALTRIELGNLSNTKSVGQGVYEIKLRYGPGYRVYFGKQGTQLIILLGGGTKQRQSNDIHSAQALWNDYKQRKREED